VSDSVHVVWDAAAVKAYDFGPGHPFAPVRTELAMALATSMGVLDRPSVRVIDHVAPATEADLRRVHTRGYLDAVRAAGATPGVPAVKRGLGTPDVPLFTGMHEAAAHIAGGTLAAARAVSSGVAQHAVSIAGGHHHAHADGASGFCVYNDVAVAIAWLLEQGWKRIAYVDVDVHHGDGVQSIFYDDPRVLTVSIHESGRTLFPGTGWPEETGGVRARGSAVNIALPPAVVDAGWLRAFDAVVPEVLHAFDPQLIVSQHGCDSHARDPLANLALSVDGQRKSYAMIHALAHELCGGRWIAVGGGGYSHAWAVPRAWTHLLAEAAGTPIDPQTPTPQAWRDLAAARTGAEVPLSMTDGGHVGFRRLDYYGCDTADPLDAAVMRTRQAVFPLLGLDVDPMW
jgi:acetoin utilization protein AcuC